MAKALEKPWEFLDSYRGKDFDGEWPTVPEMFTITASRFPERPCFTDFEGPGGSKQTLTYSQVRDNVLALACWLKKNGVEKGDRIAVSGKNSPEWGTVFLAAMFTGAVVCPIDYALHEKEMENLLSTAKPKFFFVDEEKYSHFEAGNFEFKTCSLNPKFADTYVYNLKAESEIDSHANAEDDLAVILFTSGTTGNPKGVMLTHKNLVSDTYIAQTRMYLNEKDVFYALLPIHHAYTMQAVFIESLSVGAEIVYGKSMAVTRLMKELKEGQITMLLGVPLLFNKLLAGIMKGIKAKGPVVYGVIKVMLEMSYIIKKLTGKNPGKKLFKAVLEQANIYSLRIAICGGGPLASSVFKIYNEMGIDFVQGYGLTETSPIITLNPVDHFKIESVGQYFFPWMEMKIIDKAENGVGEVAVKGPMVFKGYYNMPEETSKVFTEDGFFKTGDLGKIDKEGYLVLCGRAKNMIVTDGGKNVYPEEIENAFQLETDIAQITVQGYVEDKASKAEKIEALIYPSDELFAKLGLKRDSDGNSEKVSCVINEIVAKINKTLQPYARISKVTILEKALEMTTTQKVKRTYNKK
ncbi:AMP-dependent synthetase/ligase [Treponema sp.]|uniref:AMP-dependent synthetase/ligase n=1 Tax=Treponema sp. TaxID=166 RepID=UPI00298DF203|nr:AMP-binding protein [Treponema sp.]MCQ2240796.1 AMP-binding protein [Treponema sp.]